MLHLIWNNTWSCCSMQSAHECRRGWGLGHLVDWWSYYTCSPLQNGELSTNKPLSRNVRFSTKEPVGEKSDINGKAFPERIRFLSKNMVVTFRFEIFQGAVQCSQGKDVYNQAWSEQLRQRYFPHTKLRLDLAGGTLRRATISTQTLLNR